MATLVCIAQARAINTLVAGALAAEAYHIEFADTFSVPTDTTRSAPPDLYILGGSTALDSFCREVRRALYGRPVPILAITPPRDVDEVARILDAGSDACIFDNVAPSEVAARVRALLRHSLRRKPSAAPSVLLDVSARTLTFTDRQITLTAMECSLLLALQQHRPAQCSAGELLQAVWGYPPGVGDPALVRNHIRNLRRKVEANPVHPTWVISHHGRGYTLATDLHIERL